MINKFVSGKLLCRRVIFSVFSALCWGLRRS